jgi:hypothetical protein
MRQGVLCKEWQRTPMQLLREYCQSVKRAPPSYHDISDKEKRASSSSSSSFRVRCVLSDAKSKDKDLIFCPVCMKHACDHSINRICEDDDDDGDDDGDDIRIKSSLEMQHTHVHTLTRLQTAFKNTSRLIYIYIYISRYIYIHIYIVFWPTIV